MSGGHGSSLLQLGQAAVGGGGLMLTVNWLTGRRRRHHELELLIEFLRGRPAAPGVPAQPSLADRLEKMLADFGELKGEVATIRHKQGSADSGHAKWAEAFNRKLTAMARRLGRVERQLNIGDL